MHFFPDSIAFYPVCTHFFHMVHKVFRMVHKVFRMVHIVFRVVFIPISKSPYLCAHVYKVNISHYMDVPVGTISCGSPGH